MSRLRDLLVLIGVACAVPGSSFVLGQVQVQFVPLPPPAEKKQAEPARADAAKQQGKVAAKPTMKANMAVKAAVLRPAACRPSRPRRRIDAQAAQYMQQFRPMFRAEYYFIRNSCDLNTDQRKQLARMGETAVKAAARSFVESQQNSMPGDGGRAVNIPIPTNSSRKSFPDS